MVLNTKCTEKSNGRGLFYLQCLMIVQIFPHPHCYLKTLTLRIPSQTSKRAQNFLPYSNHYFHFSGGKLKLEVLLKEIVSMPPNSDTAGITSLDSKHPFHQFHHYQLYLLGCKHI